MKFAMLWKCGEFIDSVDMGFFLQGDLSDDHTRRYWRLDRQGGCENMLEGLFGNLHDKSPLSNFPVF